ncbi:MAG: hypothetical protein ACJ76I_11900 [Gaiellaceae bacterium]
MSTTPQFAATPNHGVVSIATANTNRDGTGTISGSFFTAGGSGSRCEEITIKADGDPADCTVVIYIYDGTNYFVFDEFDLDNPAAGSATVASYRTTKTYANLFLKSGESLRASITAAPTAGAVKVHAFGADF